MRETTIAVDTPSFFSRPGSDRPIDGVARRGVVRGDPKPVVGWATLLFRASSAYARIGTRFVMCQRYAKDAFAAVASCKPRQGIRIERFQQAAVQHPTFQQRNS